MAHRSFTSAQVVESSTPAPVAFRRWQSSFDPELFFCESSAHHIAYAAHLHDALEIIWVRTGEAQFLCRGRHYALRAGDAVMIAPNEVHAGGACGPGHFSFSTLHVPRCLLAAVAAAIAGGCLPADPLPPAHLATGQLAAHLYRDLVAGLAGASSPDEELACLERGLGRLLRSTPEGSCTVLPAPGRHPAVEKAQALLDDGFAEPMDVGSLAAQVGLHHRYLISLFKSLVGLPPHQYQIARRVDLGRQLLSSERALSNIAATAGFADQSHFNRLFKRTYRMTPSAFRDHTRPL